MTKMKHPYPDGPPGLPQDQSHEFGRRNMESVKEEDIRNWLQQGPLTFVEIDPGKPPRWIAQDERFAFWKEIRPNLHAADKPYLEDYPGAFYYRACEWTDRDGERLVVLEKYH